MLSDQDKQLCKAVLLLLSDEDVFALSNTSTNRLVAAQNRQDAVDAVLSFTQSVQEFFKRQKISKEILLRFCMENNLPVMRDHSKEKISDFIIAHWSPHQPQQLPQRMQRSDKSFSNSSRSLPQTSSPNAILYKDSAPVFNTYAPVSNTYAPVSNTYINHITVNNSGASDSSGQAVSDQDNAEAFVKWFYSVLNACQSPTQESQNDFSPRHFWENAKLFFIAISRNNQQNEVRDTGPSVHQKLLSLVTAEGFLFHPNVSREGVMIKSDSHGLKLIIVCGTLHRNGVCVGTFEQSFGLVEDPRSPNSWKIKVTCLKMDEYSGDSFLNPLSPRLKDCTQIHAIETHTTSALQQLL